MATTKFHSGQPQVQHSCRSFESLTMQEMCHLRDLVGAHENDHTVLALIYVHGSWNVTPSSSSSSNSNTCLTLLETVLSNVKTKDNKDNMWNVVGALQVDQTDDTYACVVGDDYYYGAHAVPIPPSQLPVLALALQGQHDGHARIRYLTDIPPSQLLWHAVLQQNQSRVQPQATLQVPAQWSRILQTNLESMLQSLHQDHLVSDPAANKNNKRSLPESRTVTTDTTGPALRIFVAGDRSSVGKSSVCLGLLGSLLHFHGYPASSLGYIKPATQCESKQLVQVYCETNGIACRSVPGPLVYYKGFTRAYLAGETATTQELLEECAAAVDDMCRDKRIVVVDGVGFPAVGSICGTDNAAVARACGYPSSVDHSSNSSITTRSPMGVVIVGGSGVGAAVDSFNMNATYFRHANIPVMGGIFNKLSTDKEDFYSLQNCREQVTAYFEQKQKQKQQSQSLQPLEETPFGFVPKFPAIAAADPNDAMKHVEEFIAVFDKHVNVPAVVQRAQQVQQGIGQSKTTKDIVDMEDCTVIITTTTIRKTPVPDKPVNKMNGTGDKKKNNNHQRDAGNNNSKRIRLDDNRVLVGKQTPQTHSNATRPLLTREQIEQRAKEAGAAGSA